MARKSRAGAAPSAVPSPAVDPSAGPFADPAADPAVDPSARTPAPDQQQTFPRTPPRTVAGSTWVVICFAVLILIALIIFVAQNTSSVRVTFLFLHGRFPLAVALLGAVAAGCVLTLIIGSARILQLRRIVRQRQREDIAAAHAGTVSQGTVSEPEVPGAPESQARPDVQSTPESGGGGTVPPVQ